MRANKNKPTSPGVGCLVLLLLGGGVWLATSWFGGKQTAVTPPPVASPVGPSSPRAAEPGPRRSPYPLPIVAHLAEAQRRAVWEDLFRAERRALYEADQQFPAFDPTRRPRVQEKPGDREAHSKLRESLAKKYTAEVPAKHKLTKEQADACGQEVADKMWPPPVDAHYVNQPK